MWHSELKIRCYHCSALCFCYAVGSVHGLGTSTCPGHSPCPPKKEKKKKKIKEQGGRIHTARYQGLSLGYNNEDRKMFIDVEIDRYSYKKKELKANKFDIECISNGILLIALGTMSGHCDGAC